MPYLFRRWNLVIAAYNCGPGTINKAIRRAGGEKDYWKIYNLLPKETRGYVPAFIAANYVMTYYCDHNICPMETDIPADTDTIQVAKELHFQQIADVCGVSMEQLRSLNPQYKKNIIPGDSKPYTLRLPMNYVSLFIDNQDSIYTHRTNELFSNRKTVAMRDDTPNVSSQKSKRNKRSSASTGSSTKGDSTYHKIRSGETLSTIAEKYGVSVKQLQNWNGMQSTKIAAGKRLKINK